MVQHSRLASALYHHLTAWSWCQLIGCLSCYYLRLCHLCWVSSHLKLNICSACSFHQQAWTFLQPRSVSLSHWSLWCKFSCLPCFWSRCSSFYQQTYGLSVCHLCCLHRYLSAVPLTSLWFSLSEVLTVICLFLVIEDRSYVVWCSLT